MYLSQATWPDIAFTVAYLSKFVSRYNKSHWIAIKHIIQYLKAMCSLSIMYHWLAIQHQLSPATYCDSDWGGNLNDHCSITGFIFFLCGGLFVWSSRSQSSVVLLSCEAEYNALSETIKHTLYMCKLLRPLGLDTSLPTTIRSNNQSAIMLAQANQQAFHPHMKHINIKVTHLRKTVAANTVVLLHCPTGQMIADMLTKALPQAKLEELRALANLRG
jgi:succinate dehydrogenase/fumarate reductase cytochrome b subunit